MIEDMLHAVAEASAVGAVAEFHLGMGDVRFSAGRAGVERLPFAREPAGLLGHAPPAGLHPPGDVLAEEQEKVADRGEHEDPLVPGAEDELIGVAEPGQERQPLDLHRKYEEDVDLEIGVEEREGQEHRAGDEDVRRGGVGEEKGHRHGHDIPDQQIQVIPKRAPTAFQCAPHQIEHVPGEKNEDRAHGRRNEQERDEPPPLAPYDKVGDKYDAVENEPARHLEHEKEHLPQDEIEGDIRHRVAA